MSAMTMSEIRALFLCANAGLVYAGEQPCDDIFNFIEENNIDIIDEEDFESEPDLVSSLESECLDMSPLVLERAYELHPSSPENRRSPRRITSRLSVYKDMEAMGFTKNADGKFNDWEVSRFCDSMNLQCVCDECSKEFV